MHTHTHMHTRTHTHTTHSHTHTHARTHTHTHTHTQTNYRPHITEVFWETMSGIKEPTTDDQGNINLAFHTMGLQWMNLKPKDNIDYVESEIYGLCSRAHLTVTLLPFNVICRQICMLSRREEYYVWHAVAIKDNRTVEKKMLGARAGHAWLLAENWLERSEAEPLLVGLGWLRHLVDQSMTQLGQSRT